MEEYFATVPLSNSSLLCVGGISRVETERANEDGAGIDGFGYYLFLASQADPSKPIEVLAKFTNEGAAETLARLMLRAAPLSG